MKTKLSAFAFAAIFALAAISTVLIGDPDPKSAIVLADDPTPVDPFCPDGPPCDTRDK